MEKTDWEHIRKNFYCASDDKPADWPKNVRPLTFNGISLLGTDENGVLYWDGKIVEVKKHLYLTKIQSLGAVITVFAAFIGAIVGIVEILKYLGFQTAEQLFY
jgi:hypothetical protein